MLKLKNHTVALVTAAALIGAGVAAPTAPFALAAETSPAQAGQTAAGTPVAGMSWPAAEVVAGGEVTITPTGTPSGELRFVGPADGLGYTFSTDDKTGAVTVKAPVNTVTGARIHITIGVHTLSADKTTYVKVGDYSTTVTIKPGGTNDANTHTVAYAPLTVPEKSAAPAAHTATRTGDVPAGTSFSIDAASTNLRAAVDSNGHVTVTPKDNVGAGSTGSVRVKVSYPDGSYEFAHIDVTVSDAHGNTTPHKDRDKEKYQPEWKVGTLRGDASGTATQTASLPAGTTFTPRKDLFPDLDNAFTVNIDAAGSVTLTAQKPVVATELTVPVEVTYPDGSSEVAMAPFTITESGQWQSQKASVTYSEIVTPADQAGASTPAKKNVPAGTTFSLSENAQIPEGWAADINATTGAITIKAPKHARKGTEATFYVTATFPDATTATYPVRFRTTTPANPLSKAHTVTYPDTQINPGETKNINPQITPGLPEGTQFTGLDQQNSKLTLKLDKHSGTITATVGANVATEVITLPVTVTFPDGTSKNVAFELTIGDPEQSTAPSTPATKPTPAPTSKPAPAPNPAPSNDGSATSSQPVRTAGIVLGILAALGVLGGAFLFFFNSLNRK